MNSERFNLTELENENEKIMMSHIKKIIIEHKTNDDEDITNKLRRKYDKYNLKKRKYVKKIVQKVLSMLNDENNSNDSGGMADMFTAEKNGHSSPAKGAGPGRVNEAVEKRHDTASDDINVTDEESSDISDAQVSGVQKQNVRKRAFQNAADELLNDVNQFAVNKKRCVEKPQSKRQSRKVLLSSFFESLAIDRAENFSKIIGRSQVIEEVKRCFSLLHLRKIATNIKNLLVLFVAPIFDGKRLMAKAVAAEYGLRFYELNFMNVINAVSNDGSTVDFNLDTILTEFANQKTLMYFSNLQFIDSEYVSTSVASQLMHSFLALVLRLKKEQNVFVIGGFTTCSKVFSVPNALSKFDRTIYFNIPNSSERLEIFDHLIAKHSQYDFKVDKEWMVKNSPRYMFCDTLKLFDATLTNALLDADRDTISEVSKSAMETEDEAEAEASAEAPDSTSLSNSTKKPCVTEEHFVKGLEAVQKHVALDQQLTDLIIKVSWDNIGSLKSVKNTIRFMISQKLNNLDIGCQGVILYGPPGCGKTLIAKALASENGFYFVSVRGAEFMNKYVGDSQKAVHACFRRATNNAPSIIFFDEIDAICGDRYKFDSTVANQVSAALLTEMDGLLKRDVFIVAATNRITLLDKAFTRPGRFSRILYVGLPTADERLDILKTICKSKQTLLSDDVDLDAIAHHEQCKNYSGADLDNLIGMARDIVYQREEWKAGTAIKIDQKSLVDALSNTVASVSDEDLVYYKDFESNRNKL